MVLIFSQEKKNFFCVQKKTIPPAWKNSQVPVFFDFADWKEITNYNNPKFYMFCLLPDKLNDKQSIIISMTKQTFIDMVKNNEISDYLNKYYERS